ncbi:hypothetical protein P4S72_24365 [Vibrio sp. PP-XX7]
MFFQAASLPYPQVSLEQVLVAQPEAIFNSRLRCAECQYVVRLVANSSGKHGYLWTLNADWLNRPTPARSRGYSGSLSAFSRAIRTKCTNDYVYFLVAARAQFIAIIKRIQ